MKLSTIRTDDGQRAVRLDAGDWVETGFDDVGALLASGPGWHERAAAAGGRRHAATGAVFAPVVPRPPKIVCLGLNYRSHIAEMGRDVPAHPTMFAKYAVALIGANDPIRLPPESSAVDWEVELALVVGARARRVAAADAAGVVAGFTVFNDVSMRDWQTRTIQFLQGKTFDASTPVGPSLVTLDEFEGGLEADLSLRCEVDGEVMQEGRTSDLIFGPAAIIEYASTIMTLEPGDIIATGTPSGVGAGRVPPVFLRPGNVVRTVIEGVGELVNECAAEEL